MMGMSFGFSGQRYNQIIIFNDEQDFKEIVAANPNMTVIMGDDDYTRDNFPGMYVCGIRAN